MKMAELNHHFSVILECFNLKGQKKNQGLIAPIGKNILGIK